MATEAEMLAPELGRTVVLEDRTVLTPELVVETAKQLVGKR